MAWISVLTRSISSRRGLAQGSLGLLAALLAGGHDDLAGGREDDGLLGHALEGGAGRLGLVLGLDELVGPLGTLALRLGPPGGVRLVELVLAAVELGAQLVLELAQGPAAAAAAALGLLLELLAGRACARPRRPR